LKVFETEVIGDCDVCFLNADLFETFFELEGVLFHGWQVFPTLSILEQSDFLVVLVINSVSDYCIRVKVGLNHRID